MRSLPIHCIVLLLVAASGFLDTSRASADLRLDIDKAQSLRAQVELRAAGIHRGETSVPEIVINSGDIKLIQASAESESSEDEFDLAAVCIDGTRPVCNGKPIGHEFQTPEEVFEKLRVHSE